MKKYEVVVPVSGYCRGHQVWHVEAKSEEEAKEIYWNGGLVDDDIIRDDRECQDDSDIEVNEIK